MTKTKEITKATDLFSENEINYSAGDYTGKVMILSPKCLLPQYRTRANLLWRAGGGFGCDPTKIGRAVFATCIGDGESARWDRNDFVGEFIGALPVS